MGISLCKADVSDAEFIHQMQVKAFMPLLEKYKDYETSPANESVEQMINRINQSFTDYYIIKTSDIAVGGVRIVKKENNTYRVSPIFIMPEYQGWGSPSRFLQSWNRDIMTRKNGSWIVLSKSRGTVIYMKR